PTLINKTNQGARRDVTAADLQTPAISDDLSATSSHGTVVAHFAAGRGGRFKAGTGLGSQVSVDKGTGVPLNRGAFNSYSATTCQAGRDPLVRVLNFSNGVLLGAVIAAMTPAQVAALMAFNTRASRVAEYFFDTLSSNGVIPVFTAGNDK